MEYQFPEHWIPLLGKRIKNVHLKEFTKKGTDHSLEAFRPLLDGTADTSAVGQIPDEYKRLQMAADTQHIQLTVLPPAETLSLVCQRLGVTSQAQISH